MPCTSTSIQYQPSLIGSICIVISTKYAPSTTSRRLVSFNTVYAPTKTPLGKKPLYPTYCGAVIDAILELYRASNDAYWQIVGQWADTDCQAVLKQFEVALSGGNILKIIQRISNIKAASEGWNRQIELMRDFVKRYCNRPSVLKKGKAEIELGNSFDLVIALLFHTIFEHKKIPFDELNTYRGEARPFSKKHKHSRKWDKFVNKFKRAGFELVYGENIRDTAHLFVRVRILRIGTIDECAAKYGISTKNLLDRLEPFDKAMGYDRHPG